MLHLLHSDANDVRDEILFSNKPYMDMNQPLTHYIHASSHNTYLLADQLKGPSSCKAYENALLVVAGAKRVTLYPPGAAPALKPVPPEGLYAAAEPHEPCDGALQVIVRAGDTLYLPVGWWHSVSCVAEGVTASLHLWATPRAAKVRAAAASAAASARCTPLPQ